MNKFLCILSACLLMVIAWGCDTDNKVTNPDDTTAPATISNLRVMGDVDSTCILTWTAPGDDGSEGTASSYDIRYATDSVSLILWENAYLEDVSFHPSESGKLEIYEVSDLHVDSQYFFAIKATDESANTGGISNIASEPAMQSPSISITYPVNDQGISELTEIIAETNDSTGIGLVKFFVDGELIGTDAVAPYSIIWSGGELEHGSQHTFYAQALDTDDNLWGSTVIVCQADTMLYPPTPSQFSSHYSLSDSSMILIWNENTDIDFGGYVILYDTVDFSDTTAAFNSGIISESDSTIIEVTGLRDMTPYYFQIQTIDAFLHRSSSNMVLDTTLNGPPDSLTLHSGLVYYDSILLHWTESTAHDFESYSLYRSLDDIVTTTDQKLITISDREVTTYADTDVDSGVTYYYAVYEEDMYGLATFSNTVTVTAILLNYALEFIGNDYCVVPHYPELDFTNEFTIEAWVYPYSHNSFARIVDKTESTCCLQYNLLLNDGRVGIDIGRQTNTFSRVNASSPISLSEWHHVALTYSSGIVKYYVDGVYTESDAVVIDQLLPFTTELNFGRRKQYDEFYFNGVMDEIRMWNVARSDAEILTHHNKYLSGSESGLVGYWKFDEGSGQSSLPVVGNPCQLGNSDSFDAQDPDWVVSNAPVSP